jgi:tetratricopeptide (TPR) repeat protein
MGLRLQIALAMVLLAILGAITAYRGAIAEMESSLLEQKLDQGRLLELYFRQDVTDGALLRDTLSIRKGDDERLARQLMREADAARAQNQPERALALDLRAQEEIAAGHALYNVYWMLPTVADRPTLEQSLRKRTVQRLSNLGFIEATWSAPPNAGKSSAPVVESSAGTRDTIWPSLQDEIDVGHARVPWLALGVVGFVATLVLLTMADIFHQLALKRALLYAGIALGLVPGAVAVSWDPAIWPWFAAALVAFAGLTLLGWGLGALQDPAEVGHLFHPAELERRSYTGAHLVSHTVHGRFSQCAVLAIAVSVLLSAVVGAWFSIADTGARRAALEAVGFETDMLKRGSALGEARTSKLEDLSLTLEQRARAAVAAARERLLPADLSRGSAGLEVARLRTAKYTDNSVSWIADPDEGLEGDANFPTKVVAELALRVDPDRPANGLYRNAWEAFAKWDAARTESVAAHHRAVLFLATLTVFAVAIYLIGQALGMSGGRAAVVLAGIGLFFVLVGAVGAVRAQFSAEGMEAKPAVPNSCALDPARWGPTPGGASDVAARQFGIGIAVLDAAYTTDAYEIGIDHLRCAVELRPDFAEAKRRLGLAIFEARSSQINESYMSLPNPDDLREAIDIEQSALTEIERKGLSASRMRATIAFDSVLQALRDSDPALLDASAAMARQAWEELPATNEAMQDSRTVRKFNLAVILLARGDREAALKNYDEALAAKTRFDTKFLFSAITDLRAVYALRCPDETAGGSCATLKQDVETLTGEIVAAMPVQESDLTAAVAPGSLTAEATTTSLNARLTSVPAQKPGRIVLLWYALDPAWKSWHVLPDPSGPVDRDSAESSASGLSMPRSLAELTWACVEPGRYRVEAYSDGSRVGAVELRFDQPRLVPARFPELNLFLCAPPDWKTTDPDASDSEPAPRIDYQAERRLFRERGTPRLALLLRTAPGPRNDRDIQLDLDAAVRDAGFGGMTVRKVTGRADCLAAARPGALLARAWRTREGTAHVALAPTPLGEPTTVCDALGSLGTYYTPISPD